MRELLELRKLVLNRRLVNFAQFRATALNNVKIYGLSRVAVTVEARRRLPEWQVSASSSREDVARSPF